MARNNYLFTSESVSEGHPDKVCDRISDAVLDAFLSEEPEARVACETLAIIEIGRSAPRCTFPSYVSKAARQCSLAFGCAL